MDVQLEQYKAWYRENYQHEAPMGRVESFCAMYGIRDKPEELPPPDESFWRENPLDG